MRYTDIFKFKSNGRGNLFVQKSLEGGFRHLDKRDLKAKEKDLNYNSMEKQESFNKGNKCNLSTAIRHQAFEYGS